MARRPGLPWIGRDKAHGDNYQYRFTVNGHRFQGSTGTSDFAEAARVVGELHAQATLGRLPVRKKRRVRATVGDSLEELAVSFIASLYGKRSPGYVEKIESHFRVHFLPRWRTIVELCEPGAIDAWSSERLHSNAFVRGKVEGERGRTKKPPSPVTVHKELVSLSRFLRWAKAQGRISEAPAFERVAPVSDYKPPDYTPEMARSLLAAVPDRKTHRRGFAAREWFTAQWAQGFRPGELETLRWGDVDLPGNILTVRASNAKSGRARTIAMAEETRAVIEAMATDRPLPTALVFGRHNFRRSLELAAEKLGYPRPTRHNLRHFRLSELGGSPGTSVGALQYFAGHLHLATTDLYMRSRTSATTDMLAALKSPDSVTVGSGSTESKRKRNRVS